MTLDGIRTKLDAWADEVERVTSEKQAQQATLDNYVSVFRGQIDRYGGLRNELAEMTRRFEDDGGRYSDAYSALGGAISQRQIVHNTMSAAQPPAALVPAHTAIIAAVNDSIGAVQSALQGVEEYQWGSYYVLESTPGWSEFNRRSRSITETYNAAVSNWELAVTSERQRIDGVKIPAQPAV